MSAVEICGVILALGYLLLAMKENSLCWIAAIASSLCYLFVFFEASLFTESLLQLFFIGMSVQGLRRWRKRGENDVQSAIIHQMTIQQHNVGILSCCVGSLFLSTLINALTVAPLSLVDSAITVFSIYTTYLVTEKYLENWLYWIAIDLIATFLYIAKGLHLTAGLYGLYVVLAVVGYFQWRTLMQSKEETGVR